MLGGELAEGAVGLRVILDENEVPDFDAEIGVVVDEVSTGNGISLGGEIDVEFRTRSAGTRLAHHPKVVLHVAVDDLDFWIAAGLAEKFRPDVVGFLVKVSRITRFRGIDRCVEAVSGKTPALDDKFPCPLNGFLFKIVTEGPVPQHLEKGVVVGIITNILKVVVLAAGPYALLSIGRARGAVRSFFGA